MFGVLLTQSGLTMVAGAAIGGASGLVAGRTMAFGLVAGAGLVLAGWLWPAPTRHARSAGTALDRLMPAWQFDERHTIAVTGTPEAIFEALHAVTAAEIPGLRILTWLRRGGRPAATPSILAPPADRPVLESAVAGGFRLLADDPPAEIVVGVQVAGVRVADPWPPPEATGPAGGRGRTTATFHFLVTPLGASRCRLATETRVHASTPAMRRAFALYWRVIYPGSAFIRRMWLGAIRRRVERTPAA